MPSSPASIRLHGLAAHALTSLVFSQIVTRLPPFSRHRSTPERAAHVMAQVLMDRSAKTGVYYDGKGRPMIGSTLAHDPQFQDRVVTQTRAFLTTVAA